MEISISYISSVITFDNLMLPALKTVFWIAQNNNVMNVIPNENTNFVFEFSEHICQVACIWRVTLTYWYFHPHFFWWKQNCPANLFAGRKEKNWLSLYSNVIKLVMCGWWNLSWCKFMRNLFFSIWSFQEDLVKFICRKYFSDLIWRLVLIRTWRYIILSN